MSIALMNLTPLFAVVLVAALAALAVFAATLVLVVRQDRPVRLARHESIPTYWRHAAFSH